MRPRGAAVHHQGPAGVQTATWSDHIALIAGDVERAGSAAELCSLLAGGEHYRRPRCCIVSGMSPGRTKRRARIGIFGVLDGIEMAYYGVGAFLVLSFLVFLGVRATHRLAGPGASGAAIVALLAVAGAIARDVKRRQWSPISVGAATGYAICILAMMAADTFMS